MTEEYQSLLQFADDLTQLIQHNVVSVSSKLFAKGLVAKDVHDSVLNVDGASNQSKAAKLLSCVLDKIKKSGDQCQYFIDVLGEDSYFNNIVLKINARVRGKATDLLNDSFSSGTFPELYAGGRYITIMPLFNYISAFQEMCYVNTS